jgi:Mrp family chromosome partitioning ATPase
MRTIIGEMTAKYDQVIFDGAPALVVTDPSVLASQVDGVIIVIRAGTSTHGILQRTRNIFLHVGAHVVGAVLNGVRTTAGGYLKKNYSTFYEYRGQQLPSPAGRPATGAPIPREPQLAADIEPSSEPDPADDADLS